MASNSSLMPESPLRQPFVDISGVEIVAECQAWQPFQEHLRVGQVDIVAVNLDAESPEAALHTVERIAEVSPDCGVIGISYMGMR